MLSLSPSPSWPEAPPEAWPTPEIAPPSAQQFRDGMARVAAAVHVITTDGPGGKAGFTASAVCSVTDTPPTLLVCLNRGASVYEAFHRNHVLCVNTLGSDQRDLSNLFGGKTPMAQRFAAANWREGISGAPVLADAVVAFECRIAQVQPVGTHDVLFCQVLAVTQADVPQGLIYCGRQYHDVAVTGHN